MKYPGINNLNAIETLLTYEPPTETPNYDLSFSKNQIWCIELASNCIVQVSLYYSFITQQE